MFGRGLSPYGAYSLGTTAKTGINWSSLLSNTQKTLGIINQAIPAFYQIKPIFSNMKTMFKVVNEINRDDNKSKQNITISDNIKNENYSDNNYDSINQEVYNSDDEGPNFFI